MLLAVVAVASGCAQTEPVPEPETAAPTAAASDCDGADALADWQACAEALRDAPLEPTLSERGADVGSAFDCYTYPKHETLASCAAVDETDADVRIALVGDSHAAMLSGPLTAAAASRGWSVHPIASNGCVWTNSPQLPECEARLAQQEQLLLGGAPYDAVIVTSMATDSAPAETQEIIAERFDQLTAVGSQVVVVQDNPALTDEAVTCLKTASEDEVRAGDCDVPVGEAYVQDDLYWQVATARSDVVAIPTQNLFCTDDACPIVIGNSVVYRDGHHITATYASAIADTLLARIDEQVEAL